MLYPFTYRKDTAFLIQFKGIIGLGKSLFTGKIRKSCVNALNFRIVL